MSRVTHMIESCHTCEWVMAHIWMSHVAHHLCLIWSSLPQGTHAHTHTHTHTHTHMLVCIAIPRPRESHTHTNTHTHTIWQVSSTVKAPKVNMLQHTATHWQHTASHCKTPQHTASHCTTPHTTRSTVIVSKVACYDRFHSKCYGVASICRLL